MAVEVSFIIPCLNSVLTLRRTLLSIMALSGGPHRHEIIVVDNGCTDGTLASVADLPIRVVSCLRRGAGAARNEGARHAHGEFLAFVDSDTVLEPAWLSELLEGLKRMNWTAALGRVIPAGEESFLTRYRLQLNDWRYRGTNISVFHTRTVFPIINTAACIYRRSSFVEMGGFNEEISRLEDTELSIRTCVWGGMIYASSGARAHVYNTGTAWDYLRRSLVLGRAKVELHRSRGLTNVEIFPTVLAEVFGGSKIHFALEDRLFHWLNSAAVLFAALDSLIREKHKITATVVKPSIAWLRRAVVQTENGPYRLAPEMRCIGHDGTFYLLNDGAKKGPGDLEVIKEHDVAAIKRLESMGVWESF